MPVRLTVVVHPAKKPVTNRIAMFFMGLLSDVKIVEG
jgi:hypothetical protein